MSEERGVTWVDDRNGSLSASEMANTGRRVSAETRPASSTPGHSAQERSLGARLNGSRANTRRTIGSKNSRGSVS